MQIAAIEYNGHHALTDVLGIANLVLSPVTVLGVVAKHEQHNFCLVNGPDNYILKLLRAFNAIAVYPKMNACFSLQTLHQGEHLL